MRITAVEAVEVTLPIEATLRHSYGVHRAFTRTIVWVHGEDGLSGLGETAAPAQRVTAIGKIITGLNVFDIEVIRQRVAHRFYWSQEPLVMSALEMACLDLQGRAMGLPGFRLLGGAVRDTVDLAAYCFYRYAGRDGLPAVDTPEAMTQHATQLVTEYGYKTVKLKGGVLEPAIEIETLQALRGALGPQARLRFDPNAAWTPITATRYLPAFEEIGLEYLEDPAPFISGMRMVRSRTSLALATNMCVVSFADLHPAVMAEAVDVVLSDLWYWGGPTQVRALAGQCAVLGLTMGMHSGIELGIGMAAMLHTAVTIPSLRLAIDAHYHHLCDDIIVGERLLPVDGSGSLTPPDGPGWGIELDPDKVARYAELHRKGHYANVYDSADADAAPDPERPGWRPVMPQW